jgi:precorrin isomerase
MLGCSTDRAIGVAGPTQAALEISERVEQEERMPAGVLAMTLSAVRSRAPKRALAELSMSRMVSAGSLRLWTRSVELPKRSASVG